MKTNLSTITLADQVEKKIIEYIKENNLTPGCSLPKEMQFTEMMGISRNIVRESLSRLRMLGIIQTRSKRGIIITEPPLLNGFSKVVDPNLLSIKTIKDMLGMRIALETGITDFIFANINNKDIEEMEVIVERQKALGVHNLSIEDEIMFHQKIYSIAGNKFIMQFQELIYPIFIFSKQNYENYYKPINLKLIHEKKIVNHSDIFEFLKSMDKEGYRKAIRMHLQTYWEFIYNFK